MLVLETVAKKLQSNKIRCMAYCDDAWLIGYICIYIYMNLILKNQEGNGITRSQAIGVLHGNAIQPDRRIQGLLCDTVSQAIQGRSAASVWYIEPDKSNGYRGHCVPRSAKQIRGVLRPVCDTANQANWRSSEAIVWCGQSPKSGEFSSCCAIQSPHANWGS